MENLKARRLAIKLTQQQMATLCGVSYNTYRMWEYGMTISAKNLENLERILVRYET